MKRQLTAIIYARYSPRPKRKKDRDNEIAAKDAERNSCDVQIADLRAYCAERGYLVDEALIFRDDAKSGKAIRKRRGLRAAFKAARRGMVFVCRDTKRLARNMLDSFWLVRRLTRGGVLFESLVEGRFDSTDPGKFGLFGIRAVMAEMERLNTSRTTRRKMLAYQQSGRNMSAIMRYGYQVDPGDSTRHVPQAEEQQVCSTIYELAAQGRSLCGIAAELNRSGVTCRGGKWNHKTVGKILERAKAS